MCGQPGSLSVHTLAQEPLPQHMCPCHVSMPCVKNTGHSSCACSLDASSKAALKSLELRMSEPQVPEPPVSQPWSHCCSVNAYTLDLRSVTGSQRTVPCIPVVMLQWEDLSPKHWNCQHSELWSHHLSMHACARCMCTHTHTHTCMCKSMLLHSKLNSQTEKWAEELNRHFKKKKKKGSTNGQEVLENVLITNSVQFSHSVVSDSLWLHESQHGRPPCPSPTPRVHSNSCPSSWWCHPAISSSVIPETVNQNYNGISRHTC